MSAAERQPASDAVKQIHYLATALEAPRIADAADRLADQAPDAGWTHVDYLAAVPERKISAQHVLRHPAHPLGRVPHTQTLDDSTGTTNPRPANKSLRPPPGCS